jgi:hypothetical protein
MTLENMTALLKKMGSNLDYRAQAEAPKAEPPEIKVDLVAPPIPVRCWDWRAWRDGNEERQGWGKSSAEAVADLLEHEKADEDGY